MSQSTEFKQKMKFFYSQAALSLKEKIPSSNVKKFVKDFSGSRSNRLVRIIQIDKKESRLLKRYFSFSIGEKVRVVDGSYNQDAESNIKRFGVDPLFKNHTSEIIRFTSRKMRNASLMEPGDYVTLNLLLKFPTGHKIYVAPCCVVPA